jgi:hypothetical protein
MDPFTTSNAEVSVDGKKVEVASVTIRAQAPEEDAQAKRVSDALLHLGCPQCKIVPLGAPHICNYGVTPPVDEFELTVEGEFRIVD